MWLSAWQERWFEYAKEQLEDSTTMKYFWEATYLCFTLTLLGVWGMRSNIMSPGSVFFGFIWTGQHSKGEYMIPFLRKLQEDWLDNFREMQWAEIAELQIFECIVYDSPVYRNFYLW